MSLVQQNTRLAVLTGHLRHPRAVETGASGSRRYQYQTLRGGQRTHGVKNYAQPLVVANCKVAWRVFRLFRARLRDLGCMPAMGEDD